MQVNTKTIIYSIAGFFAVIVVVLLVIGFLYMVKPNVAMFTGKKTDIDKLIDKINNKLNN